MAIDLNKYKKAPSRSIIISRLLNIPVIVKVVKKYVTEILEIIMDIKFFLWYPFKYKLIKKIKFEKMFWVIWLKIDKINYKLQSTDFITDFLK